MAKASNVINIETSKTVINFADEKLARTSEREAKKIASATERLHVIFVRERQRAVAVQEEKGKILFEMQQLLRIEGKFTEWLQQFVNQYDFSVQTAYNYIENYKKSPAGLKAILKPKPVRSKGRGGPPKGSTGSRGARHTGAAKGGGSAPSATAASALPASTATSPPSGAAAPPSVAPPSNSASPGSTGTPQPGRPRDPEPQASGLPAAPSLRPAPSDALQTPSCAKSNAPPLDIAAIVAAFMKLSPAVVNPALAERGWRLVPIDEEIKARRPFSGTFEELGSLQRDIADAKEENRRLKASIDKLQVEYDKLKGELDKRTGKAPPAPAPIDHETIAKGFLALDERKQFDVIEKWATHDRPDINLAKRKMLWAQKIYNWLPTEPVDLRKDFRERIKYSKHEAEPHPDDTPKKPPASSMPRVPSNEVDYRRHAPPGSLAKGTVDYGRQDGRQSTWPNGNGKPHDHGGFD